MLKVSFDKLKEGDTVREFIQIARTDGPDIIHRRATDEDKRRHPKEYAAFQKHQKENPDADVPQTGVKQLKPQELPVNPTIVEQLTRLGKQQEGVAAGQAANKQDDTPPLASEVANEKPSAMAKLDKQKDEPPPDFMPGFAEGEDSKTASSKPEDKHHKKHSR